MKKVFIDTNIIIDYTKGYGKDLLNLFALQEENQSELFVNPIVLAEFYADRNLLTKKNLLRINSLFQMFSIVNLSKEIGLLAGKLLRTEQILFIADALIAATCLQHDLLLATNNKKDFSRVKNLRLFKQIEQNIFG